MSTRKPLLAVHFWHVVAGRGYEETTRLEEREETEWQRRRRVPEAEDETMSHMSETGDHGGRAAKIPRTSRYDEATEAAVERTSSEEAESKPAIICECAYGTCTLEAVDGCDSCEHMLCYTHQGGRIPSMVPWNHDQYVCVCCGD